MTRYMSVAARKAEGFPATMAYDVAEVSRQAFYDWRAAIAAGPTEREMDDAVLVAQIRESHSDFDGTYGEPRVTVERARRHRGRPGRASARRGGGGR